MATGLEDELKKEAKTAGSSDDDSTYEELIPKLYKPLKKKKVVEVLAQELPFEVEPAPEPAPATPLPPPLPEVPHKEEPAPPAEPSMLSRWKEWLSAKFGGFFTPEEF